LPSSSQATITGTGANAVCYSFTPDQEISAGKHSLTIEFEDNLGNRGSETYDGLEVHDALQIIGFTRNYPNPFKPSAGTTLYYKLTQPAPIKIMIYDLAGRMVYSAFCPADTKGGMPDVNEFIWDAQDAFGQKIANGVYFYFILSEGKILARGEMAAYE
jgi:hypothetical protein